MVVQRVVLPVAAVLAGVAALVYGAVYHRAPVAQQEIEEQVQEEEVSKTIRVPVPVVPGGGAGLSGWAGPGRNPGPGGEAQPSEGAAAADGAEAPPPGMAFITQTVKVLESVRRSVTVTKIHDVPEPAMIFDITVGGIAWGPGGLRRTYAPGEPPPSLCPT
jgi:hypothetical protein